MQISNILANIDMGNVALPRFQRGYVWNRDQVRGLFDSLYHRHPVGSLLIWTTESKSEIARGDQPLARGVVKLLLDGQQRVTTLYGIVRGKPPAFFEGNPQTLTGLMFHIEREVFEFYQPIRMKDDPLWIDVSELLRTGWDGLGQIVTAIDQPEEIGRYYERLSKLLGILSIDLHEEEIVGEDKSLDVVVEIFNRVNRSGTQLSKGDLALAKICAHWPEGRQVMNDSLAEWSKRGYNFNLDWLLRSVNSVLTGEAQFRFMHDKSSSEVQNALGRARKAIDASLNMVEGHLGLDHDRVLFGRNALPVMVRYLDKQQKLLSAGERDKLLFWFVQAGMWGRFSGSTESSIDQDLEVIDNATEPLDTLIEQLKFWHGGLRTEPGHFSGSSVGARFYPVLYMLTRMGDARDFCSGTPLKEGMLGKLSKLELHHIFPKSQLYGSIPAYDRSEVNALANFCFLTKECNLKIGNRLPEEYFPVVNAEQPGALESQWIPMDAKLWKLENYREFLAERRRLLADEANRRMGKLLHGDTRWIGDASAVVQPSGEVEVLGGIHTEDEEAQIEALNSWIQALSLPRGDMSYDYTDPETGSQLAVFDLAWPEGIQVGLSQPVAVLLNENDETLRVAARAGYRCFTHEEDFRQYISREISPAGVVD